MDDRYHIKNFGLVLVSNYVILDRRPVVEMFRKEPNPEFPFSGWCFLAGIEEKEDDLDFYSVETLLEADRSVEQFLFEPVGCRYHRSSNGKFKRID